jgi:hypothetical protein
MNGYLSVTSPDFSTYATLTTLVIATGTIALQTWRNAQATTTTTHVIYATETAGSASR